jgi:UDP-glucose 4-epimerase
MHIKGLSYSKKNKKLFIKKCGYDKGYSAQEIVNIFKKIKKILLLNIKKEALVILSKFILTQKNLISY